MLNRYIYDIACKKKTVHEYYKKKYCIRKRLPLRFCPKVKQINLIKSMDNKAKQGIT